MKKKILIVEDNSANMRILEMTLRAKDHILLMATDGEEALATALKEHPNLILMDIQLPKLNGLEVTRRLRNNQVFNHIPIIAITAYAMDGDEEKAITAGCTAYLPKPIDIHQLRKVIAGMLLQKQKVSAGEK